MLRITLLNATGFSAPTNNEVVTDPVSYLPSAYESIDTFSVDIMFEGKYEVDTVTTDPTTGATSTSISYVYANATNVTSTYNWSSIGLTMTKPNAYTVRLTGPARDVFTNQFYKFTLPDYTQAILPADTTQPFLSLVQYKMPSPTSVSMSYPFAVTIPSTYGSGSTTVENVSMTQWFYWSVYVAQANIATLKTKGLR